MIPAAQFASVVASAGLLATACGAQPPLAMAARVARVQCDSDFNEAQLIEVLNDSNVLEAEPRYSHVPTMNNNAEERIDGAMIRMRPPEGVSLERLTRLLQCHSAKALLGDIDRTAIPDDPFWLPNAWVGVDVRSSDGNAVVIVETERNADNIRLAALAAAFARHRGGSAPSLR
jgi:hypothetical protein